MKKILFSILTLFCITSNISAQTQLIVDGGFEAGPGGTAWTQSSTNFGTPICNLTNCGNGNGTGPKTGTYWAWFGGFPGGVEVSSVSQSVVIPNGSTANLTFGLEQPVCDSPQDFLNVKIDGNIVFTTNGGLPVCGVTGYSQQFVNLSAYADGNSHLIEFSSTTFSFNTGSTNFFIDDVSLIAVNSGGCPNIALDGGLESGGGAAWNQTSTNFGTPICNIANCGTGGGTGPRTGNYWARFGGFSGGIEISSLNQTINFPSGNNTTLKFYLEQKKCDSPQDFLEVRVDNQLVFYTNGSSPLCGQTGYALQTVNLTAFADGQPHVISFNSNTYSVNGTESNFFVDDIAVESCSPFAGGCTSNASFAGLSVSIPDNSSTGIDDIRTVSGITGSTLGGNVKLSAVCFTIDHTWVGDLVVKLTSPAGTTVTLADRPGFPVLASGCNGVNMNACIIRGTGNELENVCGSSTPSISGTFTAANGTNLDQINLGGGSPNGDWKLNVADLAGSDVGTITSWQLTFDNGPVANWNDPADVCANASPISLNPLVTGTSGGTWSGPGVNGSLFNPAGLSGDVLITYSVGNGNCTDAKSHLIHVYPAGNNASYSYTPSGLTVLFNNTSTPGANYLWNFGDGNSSTDFNPAHTYNTAGFYTVTLTVTTTCDTATATQLVGVVACNEKVTDGGFEAGPGSGAWTEYSSNLSTPLCNINNCGTGSGSGPRTGTSWAWFGGLNLFEESSISQTFGPVPASNSIDLFFWLEQYICDSPSDFLKVAIDNDTVFTATGSSAICGQLGYAFQNVNLNAYADNQIHTITFISRVYGQNGGTTNFFVDDIQLLACVGVGVHDLLSDKSVQLYPVPASDLFEIRFNETIASYITIEVFDMMGKEILSNSYFQPHSSISIDAAGWNKGMYLIKISSDNGVITRRIPIQ